MIIHCTLHSTSASYWVHIHENCKRVVTFYLPPCLYFSIYTPSSLELGHALCSDSTMLRLDFCRCLNVKLSAIGWGFSLLKFQPIGDSFTFRHLQKSGLSTVLLEHRAYPSSNDQLSKASLAHFYVKLAALFKHNFLSCFQVKWPLSWAHLKAENVTMSKLTLYVIIWESSPEISGSKHKRAFFLDTLYFVGSPIFLYILWLYPSTKRAISPMF